MISMRNTWFHVSTWECKGILCGKTSVLLERGEVPVISMRNTWFHVSTWERKVNRSGWLKNKPRIGKLGFDLNELL